MVRDFEPCHPFWLGLVVRALQASLTRLGEALRLCVPARGPIADSLVQRLNTPSEFVSSWAELEVALWFCWEGYRVEYQPERAGPDLVVLSPSGEETGVEVKAPRHSDAELAHEKYLMECIAEYSRLLNERGLRSFRLSLTITHARAEEWSAKQHEATVGFVAGLSRREARGARSTLSGGWQASLAEVPGGSASASTWGPSWATDPERAEVRIARHLPDANKQLAQRGGGQVVFHTVVGQAGAITPSPAQAALEHLDDHAVSALWICSAGRTWSDLRMEGVPNVCS